MVGYTLGQADSVTLFQIYVLVLFEAKDTIIATLDKNTRIQLTSVTKLTPIACIKVLISSAGDTKIYRQTSGPNFYIEANVTGGC